MNSFVKKEKNSQKPETGNTGVKKFIYSQTHDVTPDENNSVERSTFP